MLKYYLLYFGSLISLQIKAQTTRTSPHEAYAKLCAYSSVLTDAFSVSGNQASLATVHQFAAGVAGGKRFLIKELADYRAAIIMPTPSGNFGVQLAYFGNIDYHESVAALVYARKMGKIDVGVQCNYNQIKTRTYPGHSFVTVEGGLICQLTDLLRLGIQVYNLVPVKVKQVQYDAPTTFSAGCGYEASKSFYMGVNFEKIENLPVNIHAGIHYAFNEKIFIRTGISVSTQSFFLGIGFMMQSIRINATAALHPYLGLTPALLLLYQKSKLP